MNNQIHKIWQQNNYIGFNKLWPIIKKHKEPIKYKDLQDFYKNNRTLQLHKKTIINKKNETPFITANINFDWQADLLDMSKYTRNNEGYKWILIVIDIFNRKSWAHALKTKTNTEVNNAFNKIINDNKIYPKRILTDEGGEFKGIFNKTLINNDVSHRMVKSTDHNLLGVINRFSRTLKEIIFKYFTENKTTKWIDKLQFFINSYNNIPHSGICNVKPNEGSQYFMTIRNCFLNKIKHKPKYNFNIDDIVRIKLKKSIFDKGYERIWSKNTFKISKIVGQNYILNDGTIKRGIELQKVNNEDIDNSKDQLDKDKSHAKFRKKQQKENIGKVDEDGNILLINNRLKPINNKRISKPIEKEYHVDSIVNEKIENDKKYYLVHWTGYAEETWEPYKNIKDLKAYDNWLINKK